MPTISQFYGISIEMYYNDHAPPHFHVYYGDEEAIITIDPIAIHEGQLSNRTWRIVKEWAELHQEALREDWQRAQNHESLKKIPPLR